MNEITYYIKKRKMKKNIKTVLITLSTLALVACNGGGGGGGSSGGDTPAPSPSPTPTNTPTPIRVTGTIAFSPAYTTMFTGGVFTTVLTLSGAQNLPSDVVVTLFSASPNVATVTPETCTLSVKSNTCSVTIKASSAGTALINATASGYTITPFTTSIASLVGVVSLPQTGQTPTLPITATIGMDGYTYFGVPWAYVASGPTTPVTRFTVGTGAEANCVTDNLTGLMWVKDLNTVKINSNAAGSRTNWKNALDSIATANSGDGYCGHTDWYLPTVNDLSSLLNYSVSNQSELLIEQGFSNVQTADYWSSTSFLGTEYYTWSVNFFYGSEGLNNPTYTQYVWPVRLMPQ